MNEQLNQPVPVNHSVPVTRGFFDGNPKMLFIFGLVTGVALTLILGNFTGLTAVKTASSRTNNSDGVASVPVTNPSAPSGATAPSGQLAAATDADHIRGDLDKAKVTLIEYSDFECPFCSRHHPTMLQVMAEYSDQVVWVYRHYPLSFHPQAQPAALASECAAEQGKFWEYADALFANQSLLTEGYYSSLADELGLNKNKFNDCFNSQQYQAEVDADLASGVTAGVSGTPATFINGRLVSGAVPYATIKSVIDAELAK